MFGKCLKHDLRAIWRVWWIAAASAFGMGAVGSLAVRGIIEVNLHIEEVNGAAVFFLSLVLSAVAIAALFRSCCILRYLHHPRLCPVFQELLF